MPFITANKIHDGHGWLPEGSVIEVADDGTIIAVSNMPNSEAIVYDGILTPGFVNVHCHLELSHMKGVVPEHTGLINFLKNIPKHRNDFSDEQKKAARIEGLNELLQNGVVAVGDISNTADTRDIRALDQLHFYTFVESLGFNDANAGRSFNYALETYHAFASQEQGKMTLKQSIAPHAPYSVSSSLFRLISEHNDGVTVAIHNQESAEEDKYFTAKEGNVADLLHTLGIDDSLFTPSGRSSLQTYLQWLSPGHPMVFVHNTYTRREDVQFAQQYCKETYWCLCPNANLYIENRLPDIDMFLNEGAKLCVGTDSLASNHQLSILAELQSIKKHFPQIEWERLFTWATWNGACALQLQDIAGAFAPCTKPGILHIADIDTAAAKVQRIV